MNHTTPETVAEFHASWRTDLQKLRTAAPETARTFGALHHSAIKDGALTAREKELIALAIGLTQGCDPCIYLHTEGAIKAGATRAQVFEAAGVAVMMQGGPAFVHLPEVLAALEHSAPVSG